MPEKHADAEAMAERIIAQLQHANSAVVLTTIKILLYLMNYMEKKQLIDYCCKKIGPPLGTLNSQDAMLELILRHLPVTLLSSGPEVQYVVLRNILLIIQRRPAVLKNDVKVFFCKYNDPIFVKLAKLEIMYRLAREENALEVLSELQEYGGRYIHLRYTDFRCEGMLLKSMSTSSERLSAPLGAWLLRLMGPQTDVYKHCLNSWRPRFLMLFKKQPL